MNSNTLSPELLQKINAYWRAANYLSVGQIYLYRQSSVEGTAEIIPCEASGGRTLGHNAGPELYLCTLKPGYQEV